MLYLNSENKKIFVFILIHPVVLLLVVLVYDAMNYIQSNITTICVGTASMASFVLAGELKEAELLYHILEL
jgi:ATP-dependent protease ClpP protease subunit